MRRRLMRAAVEALESRRLLAVTAMDDGITVNEDGSILISDQTLLANDLGAGGIVGRTQPANGTLTSVPGKGYLYTPNPNFHGTDSFQYTAQSPPSLAPGLYMFLKDQWGANLGQTQLASASWAASRGGSLLLSNIGINKFYGAESPGLFAAAAGGGDLIPQVEVSAYRPDGLGGGQEYLRLTAWDVSVMTAQHSDGAGGDLPTEGYSLSFEKIELQTIEPGGKVSRVSYDVRTGIADGASDFPLNSIPTKGPGMFLEAKLPHGGVDGEGSVQVDSFSIGGNNPIQFSPGLAPGPIGKPQFSDLNVGMGSASAAAVFFDAVASGGSWDSVSLVQQDSFSGTQTRFLTYDLRNAMVSNYSLALDNLGVANQFLSLTYDRIEMKTDLPAADSQSSYDLKTEQAVGGGSFGLQDLTKNPPGLFLNHPKGDIEVLGYSFSADNVKGSGSLQPIGFTSQLNPGSAGLLASMASGKGVDDWTLERRDGFGQVIERWLLEGTFVESYQVAGSAGGLPSESFRLAASKVTHTNTAQGSKGPLTSTASWDQVKQTGTAPGNFGGQNLPGVTHLIDFAGLGQVEVSAYSFGVASDPGTANALAQDVQLTLVNSAASPKLMHAVASAQQLPQVTIISRRSTGTSMVDYAKYVLQDVVLTSFQRSFNAGGGNLPQDQLTLHYREVAYTATAPDQKGGTGKSFTVTHDFAAAQPQGTGGGEFPLATLTSTQRSSGSYLEVKTAPNGVEGTGFVPIEAFSFGVVGDKDSGPRLSEIFVTTLFSSASAVWLDALAQQGMWDEMVLTVPLDPGTSPLVQYTYTLKDVRLTTYLTGHAGGDLPVETISLSFGQIKVDYVPFTSKGGGGTPVSVSWNPATQKVTGPADFGAFVVTVPDYKVDFGSGQAQVNSLSLEVERSGGGEGAPGSGPLTQPYVRVSAGRTNTMPGILSHALSGLEIPSVTLIGAVDLSTGTVLTRWDLTGVRIREFSTNLGVFNSHEGFTLYYDDIRYTAAVDTKSKNLKYTSQWSSQTSKGASVPDYAGQQLGSATKDTALVTITVNPVNDAPSFTGGGDVRVKKDAAAQTLAGWARNISAGPGEAGQALAFIVKADDPSLFSTQPKIDAQGTLTFATVPGKVGSTAVRVLLRDDGGTAAGGVDTSAEQTFSVIVVPPPTVTQFALHNERAPLTLAAHFSGNVGRSLDPKQLVLSSSAGVVPLDDATFAYDEGSNTATWTLREILQDGNYRATLRAGITDDVGNELDGDADGEEGGTFTTVFTQLAADADHDGAVGHLDFLILQANFGKSGDQTKGDVDYNGAVNFADYQRLGRSFGETAASFPAASPAPGVSVAAAAPAPAPTSVFGRSRIAPATQPIVTPPKPKAILKRRVKPGLPLASEGIESS